MIIDVLKSEKGYMFTLPSNYKSYNSEYYRVDGEKVESGKTYTTTNEPVIEVWKSVRVEVKAKSKADSKPDLALEEYYIIKNDLESKKVWDEYKEYTYFKDLEDEYNYKVFMRDYEIITRVDEEKINTFELNIKEKLESPNPYIMLHRHIGKELTSQAASYNRWSFYKNYLREYLKEKGYEETDATSAGKGLYKIFEYNQGMVNLYMEGKQLFDIKVHTFNDELDIVIKKYEEDKKWIEDKIDNYVRNTSTLPNVQDVIGKLISIRNKVTEIDSKQKTYDQYRVAIRWIDNYINELEHGSRKVTE